MRIARDLTKETRNGDSEVKSNRIYFDLRRKLTPTAFNFEIRV